MDRRNISETAGNRTDTQLRSALDVITASYKGATAERIYRDAIVCFDGLIEISHNTEAILNFARRHNIDNKYLVDGANFVISRMHFNPEGNYYITMGLSQNVSQEEIRERWKKLMLLYHPDRQGGDESWVSERAKKVNEAYNVLKDEEQRQAFDRKLLEKAISGRPAPQSRTTAVATPSRGSSRKISQDPEWDRKKRKIPMLLVGVYLIVALIILGYIYSQNNGERIESALSSKDGTTEQTGLRAGAGPEKNHSKDIGPAGPKEGPPQSMGLQSEGKKTEAQGRALKPAPAELPAVPPANRRQNVTAAPKGHESSRGSTADGALDKQTTTLLPQLQPIPLKSRQADAQETAQKSSTPLVRDMPAPSTAVRTPEPQAPVRREVASRQQEQLRRPGEISREEVEEFMKRYCAAYSNGDLRTFMSLLSRTVVENNKLHYNEVRDAYRDTFSEKINSYRLNNMSITINDQTAVVSALYDLSRYTSAEDRWVRYSGKIQWKIAKENHELKIVSSTYDK